jgi:hypothetical protein
MNWGCLLGHNWKYSNEKHLVSLHGSRTRTMEVVATVRICDKCYKKQRKSQMPYKLNWIDLNLTKAEKREMKLKQLGI